MNKPTLKKRVLKHIDQFGHGLHFHVHAFRNKEIDSLYITLALLGFASGLVSVFVPGYLLNIDYEIWEIVLFYCLKSTFHVLLLFLLVPLLRHMSDKLMMMVGIMFLALYLFGLSYMAEIPVLFYLLPIAHPFYMIFFWFGYHIDFATASDDDHVGEEVGTNLMLTALAKFAAPVIGGFIIGIFGFSSGFTASVVIILLALIPLLWLPSRNVDTTLSMKRVLRSVVRDNKFYRLSSLGYANEKLIEMIVWPLFIFLVVGSVEQLGGIISFGLLVGGLTTYIAGRYFDGGKGKSVVSFGSLGIAGVWFLRILILQPIMVVFTQVFYFIVHSATLSAWTSQYYQLAEKAESLSTFIVSQEFTYNASRVVVLGLLSLIAYIVPVSVFFTVSFASAGLLSFLYLFASKKKVS